ncbi:TNF receptor-associated factor 6-like isoform X1 [Montipora capricornis]|uniref:TNF receptor-associated factor 6-like isoform X1 n=1 Tax=Montipora capricornis TaxID=246305 RepID=UPI0035F1891B
MAEQQGSGAFGGYDDEFVDAIEDDWLCPICRLPLKVPVQTRGCGHRFCELCLERHFMRQERDGQQLTCPLDQNVLIRDKDIFPDKAAERKVRSFVIKCPRGCQWTGELRSKEDHDSECRRFPVNCPNCCGELVPREEISSHTENNCSLAPIPCPFAEMGCNKKVPRPEIESHLNSKMRMHLDLVCTNLKNAKEELRKTKEHLEKTEEQLQNTKERFKETTKKHEERIHALENKPFIYMWKIDGFSGIEEKIKYCKRGSGSKALRESCPFYTGECSYKVRLRLELSYFQLERDNCMKIYLIIMKGDFDSFLKWPFAKRATITVLDQRENSNERKNITATLPEKQLVLQQNWNSRPRGEHENRVFQFDVMVPSELLKGGGYVQDNSLFIQAKFETVAP